MWVLYLVVKVSVDGEFGFDLPFEESVVELLVVDVDLSHLGANLLSHFGFHCFGVFLHADRNNNSVTALGLLVRTGSDSHLLLQSLPHLLDSRPPDELWQLKRRFLDTSLALQILPFEAPVARYRHSVSGGL